MYVDVSFNYIIDNCQNGIYILTDADISVNISLDGLLCEDEMALLKAFHHVNSSI